MNQQRVQFATVALVHSNAVTQIAHLQPPFVTESTTVATGAMKRTAVCHVRNQISNVVRVVDVFWPVGAAMASQIVRMRQTKTQRSVVSFKKKKKT